MDNHSDYDEIFLKYGTNWTADYLDDIDTSQYPFPNVLWHRKSTREVAVKASAMVVIGIMGIFLNSIILTILIKNRWLWTASNYLVGNLALVDLLTLILCPWFMLVRDFYQHFVLRNFGCKFEGFLQATFLLASMGAVILVSYDRLAAAALNSEARVTKAAAPKLIFATWFIAIALSLPWSVKREFMYSTIIWRLEWSARKLSSNGGGQVVSKAKGRAMKITACVLLAAAFCRIPYTVLVYWRNNLTLEINAVEGAYNIMWFVANYLIYVNCAINPLIYGFTNLRFRRAMDRTDGVAWFRFSSWCCTCSTFYTKKGPPPDKNMAKIFVIETSPCPNKKITRVLKNILHINRDTIELSMPKVEEVTTKPTKITPIKVDNV
ncbi:Neuropeptide Y receptor [Papilio machaon]|uniref:Neuropeptide Y receptor n=1 Tax=Papilio machaon TaxID=76193 RepID=A0A194RM84_PAPMA|nr:Neuropeptide Y receptor [Papilio machaon]